MIDSALEYRLLASLIDNPDVIFRLTEKLFTSERISLFRAIREAYLRYGEITHEGVEYFYGAHLPGELDAARGAKPEPIIDRLQSLLRKRQLADISNKINILMSEQDPQIEDIQAALQFDTVGVGIDSSLAEGITEFVSDLQRKRSGQYKFVRTGLNMLDFMLGGEWGRKALTMIKALPGGGKTALVCSSMLNMAQQGQGSLFISIEMPKDRVVSRLVAGLSEINNRDLRSGSVTEERLGVVNDAVGALQELPIYIVHKTGITIDEILYQIRIHKERFNIDAVFVDYLQIIGRDETDEVRALGDITQRLRDAAERFDLAVILLVQENYNGMIFGSSKPLWIADNLLEIKSNEEDAGNDDLRIMEINFVKNREGPLGRQSIRYVPKYLKFLG